MATTTLRLILKEHVRQIYATKNFPPWKPTRAVGKIIAIYYLRFKGGKSKFGMAQNLGKRVKDQNEDGREVEVACCMMTREEMEAFVPEQLLQRMYDLNLPALCFHPDHNGKGGKRETLCLKQLCELFYSCVYENDSKKCGERLFHLPTKAIQDVVSYPGIPDDVQRLLSKHSPAVDDSGSPCLEVHGLFTWPTLSSHMHNQKQSSPFLQSALKDLPEGEFVKSHRFSVLNGEVKHSWQDAVSCPRVDTLHKVIHQIRAAGKDAKKLVASLALIQGKHKDHYERPQQQHLAKGGIDWLRDKLSLLDPKSNRLVVEDESFSAIQKFHFQELNELVDMSTFTSVNDQLNLVVSRAGHIIEVTGSYFVAMAEGDHTLKGRINNVKRFVGHLFMRHHEGLLSLQDLYHHVSLMQAFLMRLVGPFGDLNTVKNDVCKISLNEARYSIMPMGYFQSTLKRASGAGVVSDILNIGPWETLFLWSTLDRDSFYTLLKAHEWPSPTSGLCPMDPEYRCPGRSCLRGGARARSLQDTPFSRIGFNIEKEFPGYVHPFRNQVLCASCKSSIQRLELNVLRDRQRKRTLDVPSQKRLLFLENPKKETEKCRIAMELFYQNKAKVETETTTTGKETTSDNINNDKNKSSTSHDENQATATATATTATSNSNGKSVKEPPAAPPKDEEFDRLQKAVMPAYSPHFAFVQSQLPAVIAQAQPKDPAQEEFDRLQKAVMPAYSLHFAFVQNQLPAVIAQAQQQQNQFMMATAAMGK
eukprot:CAMPEP_0172472788 /NCGR_PEP_ID=MMETSP1065-20121228/68524_1 /TAXON_ID=265537 /ORGANISM="Amphiprora paludosa, Strain CCMP125" /LENGTH=758 /DNA_ID=CAMNT_0013230953 /DNA_START=325 /DNA_END=2601 /DNA_ORIENTATION=-